MDFLDNDDETGLFMFYLKKLGATEPDWRTGRPVRRVCHLCAQAFAIALVEKDCGRAHPQPTGQCKKCRTAALAILKDG